MRSAEGPGQRVLNRLPLLLNESFAFISLQFFLAIDQSVDDRVDNFVQNELVFVLPVEVLLFIGVIGQRVHLVFIVDWRLLLTVERILHELRFYVLLLALGLGDVFSPVFDRSVVVLAHLGLFRRSRP